MFSAPTGVGNDRGRYSQLAMLGIELGRFDMSEYM